MAQLTDILDMDKVTQAFQKAQRFTKSQTICSFCNTEGLTVVAPDDTGSVGICKECVSVAAALFYAEGGQET